MPSPPSSTTFRRVPGRRGRPSEARPSAGAASGPARPPRDRAQPPGTRRGRGCGAGGRGRLRAEPERDPRVDGADRGLGGRRVPRGACPLEGDGWAGSPRVSPGDERYISDYLRMELERELRHADVTFLTRTAILETIAPPVAEAVSGQPGAERRIRSLARDNLFIQEIGVAEPAFRYHNLLRDFLLAELERREPGGGTRAPPPCCCVVQGRGEHGPGDRPRHRERPHARRRPLRHRSGAADRSTAAARHPRPLAADAFEQRDFERIRRSRSSPGGSTSLTGAPTAADRMADIVERSTFDGIPEDGSVSFESGRAMLRAIMVRNGPKDMLANAELRCPREAPGSRWRANAFYSVGMARLAARRHRRGRRGVRGVGVAPARRLPPRSP